MGVEIKIEENVLNGGGRVKRGVEGEQEEGEMMKEKKSEQEKEVKLTEEEAEWKKTGN